VEGLDKRYTHKVAVIQNYDNTQSYVIEGLHTVNDNSITYTTPKESNYHAANLLKTPPAIKKSGGVNSIQQRPIFIRARDGKRVQPVVNLMGQFFKWQTSIAKEDLYKDGVASANYQGFNRRNLPSWSKIQDGYWTKTQDSFYRKKLLAKTQR
jgi:hypothetical protein